MYGGMVLPGIVAAEVEIILKEAVFVVVRAGMGSRGYECIRGELAVGLSERARVSLFKTKREGAEGKVMAEGCSDRQAADVGMK